MYLRTEEVSIVELNARPDPIDDHGECEGKERSTNHSSELRSRNRLLQLSILLLLLWCEGGLITNSVRVDLLVTGMSRCCCCGCGGAFLFACPLPSHCHRRMFNQQQGPPIFTREHRELAQPCVDVLSHPSPNSLSLLLLQHVANHNNKWAENE